MKIKLLIISLFCSLLNFAQNTYQPGYLISTDSTRIECLILNKDWMSNPTKISYKISTNTTIQTRTLENTAEFGIYGKQKFIKFNGNIERSSSDAAQFTTSRNPKFKKETIFLRVLIEGDANLYEYIDSNLIKFFYKTKTTPITQLVRIEHLTNKGNSYAVNNMFRQQLYTSLNCNKMNKRDFDILNYKKNDLQKVLTKHNNCITP